MSKVQTHQFTSHGGEEKMGVIILLLNAYLKLENACETLSNLYFSINSFLLVEIYMDPIKFK